MSSDDEEADDGADSDSDDESSAKARYFGYVKQGLYYVTEMERFAPPRKRPRTVTKNYRLVSLRSTTPEELYQRKVGRRPGLCLSGTCDFLSFQWLTALLVSVALKRIHITAAVLKTFFRNSESSRAHLATFFFLPPQTSVMPRNKAAYP